MNVDKIDESVSQYEPKGSKLNLRKKRPSSIIRHAQCRKISTPSVERNIQRMREANFEKQVVKLMQDSNLTFLVLMLKYRKYA